MTPVAVPAYQLDSAAKPVKEWSKSLKYVPFVSDTDFRRGGVGADERIGGPVAVARCIMASLAAGEPPTSLRGRGAYAHG